ncbi:GEVED domain-containing protein [Pedobacter nototheniae]|uniref:GEVED domain-containing protein n=1 Tax=Pedobacter nototheniae TaxID=2488994 RepID=UPI0037449768
MSGWIDFDQNGIFDDSERVTVSAPANQTSVDLTWIIPANRVNKNTYVRVCVMGNQRLMFLRQLV